MNLTEARKAFLLACLAEGSSPQTIRRYGKVIRDFIEYIGDPDLNDLEPVHVVCFVAELGEKIDPLLGDQSRQFRLLRDWLRWCKAQSLLPELLAEMLTLPELRGRTRPRSSFIHGNAWMRSRGCDGSFVPCQITFSTASTR